MKSGFYYLIKDEFFDKFEATGSHFKYNKGESRPTYCCIEDNIYPGLFWAIPTGSVNQKRLEKVKQYELFDEKDIRYSYYHLGYTNKKAIFYISSAFPITDKYVLREYTTGGIPLELKREKSKEAIKRKLLKILTFENQHPNKLETHITDIKNELLKEL